MSAGFFGHVSVDQLSQSKQHGGSSLYGAMLMSKLVNDVYVTTSVDKNFPVQSYPQILWNIRPSEHTTTFEIKYANHQRFFRLLFKGEEIDLESIPEDFLQTKISIVCPIVDEVGPNIIPLISSKWIGLTPQGWFRKFDVDGAMTQTHSIFSALPKKIQLIVISQDDLIHDSDAWDWIKKSSSVAVRTMGQEGYVLSVNEIEKKFSPMEIIPGKNPTGCGDIFSSALLFLLSEGFDPEEAAQFAGHAAGLSSLKDSIEDSAAIASEFLQSKI